MKRALTATIVLALAIAWTAYSSYRAGYNNGQNQMENHCYPLAGIVTEVDCAEDIVTITDCAGLSWEFYGVEDWCEGDIASCIMHDNGTPKSVYDDTIVKVYYAGGIENGEFWISNK